MWIAEVRQDSLDKGDTLEKVAMVKARPGDSALPKTHRLTRIANPGTLRSIDPRLLIQLFKDERPWFAVRGVDLDAPGELDCDRIALLLNGREGEPPPNLLEVVCLIDEMSVDSNEFHLRTAASACGVDFSPDDPNVDIALKLALHNLDALADLATTRLASRIQTVDRIAAQCPGIPRPASLTPELIRRMEELLNSEFERVGRQRSVVLHPLQMSVGPALLISRGDTLKRMSVADERLRKIAVIRPEMFDLVCWDQTNGDLLVRVRSKGDARAYCQAIGMVLFGNKLMFDPDYSPSRYTMEPIWEYGRDCLVRFSYSWLERVSLTNIVVRRDDLAGGKNRITAPHAWTMLEEFGKPLPRHAVPVSIGLKFKIVGESRERSVTFEPPYRMRCDLDDVGVEIVKFMSDAGFILPRMEHSSDGQFELFPTFGAVRGVRRTPAPVAAGGGRRVRRD